MAEIADKAFADVLAMICVPEQASIPSC
jgi:hypothetical protein